MCSNTTGVPRELQPFIESMCTFKESKYNTKCRASTFTYSSTLAETSREPTKLKENSHLHDHSLHRESSVIQIKRNGERTGKESKKYT